MSGEYKVDREVAEQEFEKFGEEMDLDFDASKMDVEDLTAFNKQKDKVILAIMRGKLSFNENGEPVFQPMVGDEITLHERTGASLMAMDGKKKNHDVAKMFAILAEMARVHPSVFSKMPGRDGKVLEALFTFLMD